MSQVVVGRQAGSTAALAPLPELGRGTLSRRLVLRIATLVAALALVLGTASILATRHQLVSAVDQQLFTAVARGERFADDVHRVDGRPMPGTQVGQVNVTLTSSTTRGELWVEGGNSDLAQKVTSQLVESQPRQPTTMELEGLGSYRAVASTSPSGTTQIVALPLSQVNHTLRQLLLLVLGLTALAIAIAVAAVRAVVVRALKPLTRLAATATEVSNMALERGEVVLPERLNRMDADPRNEVGRVGFAFNHMLDNVEDALATRQASETKVRQFVADASHELRNPLASIRGYAELTRRSGEQLPTDTDHAIGRIESESTRMSRLVEDMLLLARLDNDPQLDLAEVDVVELVLNAVSDAQVAGPDHDWGVDLPEHPVTARADALKLHQVVANLLANARKHTPAGTHVTAGVAVEGRQAVITVLDDGPGVDESVRDHVFERFARGEGSRTQSSEGSTGLGLAIVAAVMEAHGGQASLDSAPGHTCFTLRIPLV